MNTKLTHEEIQDLIAVHALDATEPDEAAAVEAHVAACPRCRAQLDALRETAGRMAHTAEPPPPGVWDRIAADLDDAAGEGLPRLLPKLRRGRVSPRLVQTAVAIASVAAVMAGALGVQVARQNSQIHDLTAIVQRDALATEAATAVIVDPEAKRAVLTSNDGKLQVAAVVRKDGRGYLVENNLPAVAAERTYQLWGLAGNETISLGVLGTKVSVVTFQATAPITALAITNEVAGGVTATKNDPLVAGLLTAA